MEELLKGAISQAPGLVVLVILVIKFLSAMGKRDELIKGLTDEHLTERRLQRDILERNTVAAIRNTQALDNMAHVIEKNNRL